MTDTSREAVGRVADNAAYNDWPLTSATLRALLDERDAARDRCDIMERQCDTLECIADSATRNALAAIAERDAARVEVARLREELERIRDHSASRAFDALRAARRDIAAVLDGTAVVVPKVPTEAQEDAARYWSVKKYGQGIGKSASNGCYIAMLEASPYAQGYAE